MISDRFSQAAEAGAPGADTLSRRGFLGAGSAAAVTAVLAVRQAGPATAAPTALRRKMLVQVAQAGMAFPLRLPPGGHPGPARARIPLSRLRAAQSQLGPGLLRLGDGSRPSLARLRAAERATRASELSTARTGADVLITAGLLGSGQARLLKGIGRLAATARPSDRAALEAAVTLAVRSVFSHASARAAGDAARRWLSLLGGMHEQEVLHTVIRQRGIR